MRGRQPFYLDNESLAAILDSLIVIGRIQVEEDIHLHLFEDWLIWYDVLWWSIL